MLQPAQLFPKTLLLTWLQTVISDKACREETCAYSSRYCWKHYNQHNVLYRLYKIENSWVDHFCSEAHKSGTKEDFELAWRTLTNVILARVLHSDWFYGGQDENHQCWWNKMCGMRESLRKRLSSRFVFEIPEDHSTEIWKTIETLIVVVDPKPCKFIKLPRFGLQQHQLMCFA